MGLGRELAERFADLKTTRQDWEADWQDISRLVAVRRSDFSESARQGKRVGGDVYDGTAISALNLLANGLMGYLMGPMSRWFKLSLGNREALDLPGVQAWLGLAEDVLYADFARSALYEEGLEFFRDGGSIGTATMYIEEDFQEGTPFFSCRHPKEIYIDVDRRNRPDTVFRRYWQSARAIAQEFPDADFPLALALDIEDSPAATWEVIHAVYPRTERDATKITATEKRFASVYYLASDPDVVLRESGYDEIPYIIWRWSTNSGEHYGRSPAHDSIAKIKRANAMGRDLMRFSQRAADPPLNVPEHMRGRVSVLPRGLNYYANANDIIMPVDYGGSYPIGLEQQQDIRQIIEDDFLVDFFLLLQRAGAGMTATEVMERQAEKAAILAPVIGRIESDVLDKIIQVTFRQALKMRRIPPPPPALARSGVPLQVDYIGPLAQANQNFHVQHGVKQSLSTFSGLMELEPAVAGLLKWEEVGRKLLESTGMPAAVVRDRREYEEWAKHMAQAQAEQQQQEAEQHMIQNAGQLSHAPEPGSPMDQIHKTMAQGMNHARGIR